MATNLNTGLNFGLNPGLRQSISGGVDSLGLFRSSSLDLRFADKRTLTDRVSGNNLITFSRASIGTYVGSDGLIKTSPFNLLRYSEQFDQWTVASNSVITPNSIAAPDGTLTADLLYFSQTGATNVSQSVTLTQGQTYTISVYAKAVTPGTNNKFSFYIASPQFKTPVNSFETTSEWQKFTFTFTHTDPSASTGVYVLNKGDSYITNVYFWGAQLEESPTAGDYIPTGATISGAPRFDHDPVTGQSLGLLIEEERTNLFKNSFVPFNDGRAATGVINGINLYTATANLNSVAYNSGAAPGNGGLFAVQQGVEYVVSFYAKKVSASQVGCKLISNVGANISNTDYVVPTLDGGRVSVKLTCTQSGFAQLSLSMTTGLSVEFGGMQVEAGSFPTSLIPTTSISVTRSPDIATIEGNKFAKTNLLTYSERVDQSVWNKANTNIIPDNLVAPDGSQTAELVLDNTVSNSHQVFQTTPTLKNATDYTFSVYVKAASLNYCFLLFYSGGGAISNSIAAFDLVNNTSSIPVGSPVTNIQDVGNGWKRIAITATTSSAATTYTEVRLSQDGNWNNRVYAGTGQGVYLWGAQLEEGSELTEYTPSVDTFDSRASSATYVDDATGLIKTTPVNKLRYSNQFTNAAWTKSNFAVISSTTTAPDGTATATTFSSNEFGYIYQDTSSIIGESYVSSIWIKGNANATLGLRKPGMTNSTIGSDGTESINVTTEWQKFTVVTTSAVNTDGRLLVDLRTVQGASIPSSFQISLWHAQTEEGTTPTEYIPTTSTISGAARYENGELLLEEARTNTALGSDVVAGSPLASNIIQSLENIISPRGVSESVRKLSFGSAGSNVWRVGSAGGGTPNTTYAISFWAKTVNGGTTSFNVDINDFYPVGGISTTVDGEWKRYVKVGGDRNNTYRFFDINMLTATDPIYIWGAQIEAAPYASSYIPTTGSTVTRAADVSTSALGVDSWYNQSEGTIYSDITTQWLSGNSSNGVILQIDNGTNATGRLFHKRNASSGQHDFQFSGSDVSLAAPTNSYKAASGYNTSSYITCVDKTLSGEGTVITGDLNTLNRAQIGNNGNNVINGHISRLAYFPTRKTDQELVKLTS